MTKTNLEHRSAKANVNEEKVRIKRPKIIQVYPALPRNEHAPLQDCKIRIVKYENNPVPIQLDLRDYIISEDFTGWSWKGYSMTLEQFKYLSNLAPEIIKRMEEEISILSMIVLEQEIENEKEVPSS